MHLGKLLVISGLLIELTGAGCNSTTTPAAAPAAGVIDGTYAMAALTCNGTTAPFLDTGALTEFLIIANTTGSWVTTFGDGCVATEGNLITYPAATTVTMQKVNKVCSGTSCSGSECTANSVVDAATTVTHTLSGSTLTLTSTSNGNDGCTAGQTTVFTMTKQ